MFALGVGLFLSSFAIQFVDILQMYQILLTAWMYLTPIIYTVDILPSQFLWLVYLNPMYYLVTLFRGTIYEGRIPGINEFLVSGSIALITLLVGWFVFAQKADEFAYRI
jgi:ABC-2 type transport system permease protein